MDNHNLPVRRAAETWPQRLSRLESASIAILNYANVPALRPDERAEMLTMIDETRARLVGASGAEIGKVVAMLGLACRHPRDADEDPNAAKASRVATAELMVRYLIGYPRDILQSAADQWIKTQVFFPAIAEFRALCEPEFQRRQTAIKLMERALEASERKAREAAHRAKIEAERADPEKRGEIERRFKEAKRILAASEKTKPPGRPRQQVEMTDEQREAALANVRAGKIEPCLSGWPPKETRS